jgi:hypothetical protein
MTREPYASARRVFWVVDNGSSHAGRASIVRLEGAYEQLRLIHLPVHASWMNQVELYFSILQRKALTPNDLGSHEQHSERRRLPLAAATVRSPARSSGRSRAATSSEWTPRRREMSPPLPVFDSRPDGSGGEQNAGRGSRGARPDRDRPQQARTNQLARLACEIDQSRRGDLGVEPARGARRDHRASEPGALKRRVNRPKQLAERPPRRRRDRPLRTRRRSDPAPERPASAAPREARDRARAAPATRRAAPRTHAPRRCEAPTRPPRCVSEEGAREALIRRTAPDAAAALCLATTPTRTALIATNLRHGSDRGATTGRKAERLPAERTKGSARKTFATTADAADRLSSRGSTVKLRSCS